MRAARLASGIVGVGLALQLVAAGCSYGAAIVTDDGRPFPPTQPQELRLHPGRDPGFPFVFIGPVAVFTFGEAPDAMRELAALAEGMGADAVIEVRLSKLSKNTGASGVAVKRAPPPQAAAPAAGPTPPPVPVPPPLPVPPPAAAE
ncbi:MAG: hypothetical protein HY906_19895 [Deltaproteobacteria bacterium]|nr:hypothetical protein [Deltaproteobacteria bacterium]